MDAIKEYLRAVDRLEHGEINLGEYEELCKPLRDVRENAHGKWIIDEEESKGHIETIYTCSACHNFSAWGETEKYNYCPNCGARMDDAEMTKEEAIKNLIKYMRPATSEELEAEQTYIDSISKKFKEVVYGEWISDEDGNICCSFCGRSGVGESFCEHCGADMREREKIKVKIITESLLDRLPQYVKDAIDGKPKEMVEVVHGEWLEKEVVDNTDENFVWKIEQWQSARCSVCGKYHTTPYMYYFDNFNYCSNCGADMRGDTE